MSERLLVGIEFTADELRLALAEPDGAPVGQPGRWRLPELADEESWAWEVGGRIATAFAEEGSGRSALAIAMAAPGTVDPVAGRLVDGGQDGWEGLSVVEALRRHIDAPAAVDSRASAGLLGERADGAARGAENVLYLLLRDPPGAAVLAGGRALRGAHGRAGAIPAVSDLDPDERLGGEALEEVAVPLADAAALLDPELVVVDAPTRLRDLLIPVLKRLTADVAPGARVVPALLGADAPLRGAITMAGTLAYESAREA
ncbi:MAG: ROK family protein [Chloroflexi bacterium]|nr:ROK family protein [Chloroflexota bacterium]